jgi:hypothetical protein
MRSAVKTASSNGYVEVERVLDAAPGVLPVEGDPVPHEPLLESHDIARESAERELPHWCTERNRLIRARTRYYDTTGGNALVVDVVRLLGVGLALVTGVLIGLLTNSVVGVVGGVVACLAGWAVAAAGASAGVRYTRRLLTRQERERRRLVGTLTRSIRRLDKRIAQARLDFGLSGHAPLPRL